MKNFIRLSMCLAMWVFIGVFGPYGYSQGKEVEKTLHYSGSDIEFDYPESMQISAQQIGTISSIQLGGVKTISLTLQVVDRDDQFLDTLFKTLITTYKSITGSLVTESQQEIKCTIAGIEIKGKSLVWKMGMDFYVDVYALSSNKKTIGIIAQYTPEEKDLADKYFSVVFKSFKMGKIGISNQGASQVLNKEDMAKFNSLGGKISECMKGKDYDRVIEFAKEAISLCSQFPQPYFKLAQAYALKGDSKESIKWLRKSLLIGDSAGMSFAKNILDDEAFKEMKSIPEFQELYASVQKQLEQSKKEIESVPDSKDELYILEKYKTAKNRPMLIVLDGQGGNPKLFAAEFKPFADENGYILLAPCGSKKAGINERGPAYNYDFKQDPARIISSIQKVKDEYEVNPARIYLLGFSQGAIMGLALGLNNPDLFSGIIAIAGAFPEGLVDRSKIKESKHNLPIYLLSGKKDPENWLLQECLKTLKDAGFPVQYTEFDGSHRLPVINTFLQEALLWIDKSRKETLK
ncbi:MAG: PHB depolymerase family esterase [Planctomycetota bacterium]